MKNFPYIEAILVISLIAIVTNDRFNLPQFFFDYSTVQESSKKQSVNKNMANKDCIGGGLCAPSQEKQTSGKRAERVTSKPEQPPQKTSKKGGFKFEPSHECKEIARDKDSVDAVNALLHRLHYESPLSAETLGVNYNLSIRVIAKKTPRWFVNEVVSRTREVLNFFKDEFDLQLSKNKDINLVIFPNLPEYNEVMGNLGLHSTNSQGLYWVNGNFAFVAYSNDEYVLETSVHEIVHNLVSYTVGFIPRWLNEGLASYWQRIRVKEKWLGATHTFKDGYHQLINDPESIDNLVYSSGHWSDDVEQMRYYYASALTHVKYFMSHESGKALIKDMLKKEKRDPCSVLPPGEYMDMLAEHANNAPISFQDWLDSKARPN